MDTVLLALVAVLQAATLAVVVLGLRRVRQLSAPTPPAAEPEPTEPDDEVEPAVEPGDRAKLFAPR